MEVFIMKKRLKVIGLAAASSVMLLSTSIYADSTGQSLADIVSKITGKTTTEVTEMRSDGMTYGEIAASSGKLDEFKKETGKNNCTGDGTCTYSQGNGNCDGTGYGNGTCNVNSNSAGNSQNSSDETDNSNSTQNNSNSSGLQNGSGNGNKGNGPRDGSGKGNGGHGRRDGSCINN